MNKRFQTSFIIDKKLWIKFKYKTIKEGIPMRYKLEELITDYINKKETGNGSSWIRLPKWR